MSFITSNHEMAMDLAERALQAEKAGQLSAAEETYAKAYHYEVDAISAAIRKGVTEPSRSLMLESAAHLAMKCGDLFAAEYLVHQELKGKPPRSVKEGLLKLLDIMHLSSASNGAEVLAPSRSRSEVETSSVRLMRALEAAQHVEED